MLIHKGPGNKKCVYFFLAIEVKLLIKTKNLSLFDSQNTTSSCQVGMEFYRQCTNKGMKLKSEYILGKSRFDAVLVKNGYIILIVEYKNSFDSYVNKKSRQFNKYTSFGVDVLYVLNFSKIDECVKIAENYWINFKNPTKAMSN